MKPKCGKTVGLGGGRKGTFSHCKCGPRVRTSYSTASTHHGKGSESCDSPTCPDFTSQVFLLNLTCGRVLVSLSPVVPSFEKSVTEAINWWRDQSRLVKSYASRKTSFCVWGFFEKGLFWREIIF